MKKYLLTLILIAFIVPSVALASWWNPFSWFNGWTFDKTEIAPPVQVETHKTPEEKISDLQKQLDELKNQQSISTTPVSSNSISQEKKISSVATIKPISQNQEQTKQYKKILLGRIVEIYAIASRVSNYGDIIITTIDERIDFLNSSISKNEASLSRAPNSYAIKLVNLFITVLKNDKKVSETYKNIHNTIRDNGKKIIGGGNEDATLISQKVSISSSEFEKFTATYNLALEIINKESLKQEKYVSDFKSYADKSDKDYIYSFDLLKTQIDSMQEEINNSSQPVQSDYIPPAPIITIPRIQTCSFSSNSQWGQTTGYMTCY